MRKLFKRIWEFIKRLLHIGKKELQEAALDIEAQVKAEIKELEQQLETAIDDEWYRITEKLKVRYMHLAEIAGAKIKEQIKELQELHKD